MAESALLLARAIKLLAEIALLAGLGEAALGWLLGARREHNLVHGLFRQVTAPARWLGARLVRHPGARQRLAGWLLLLGVWICAVLAKLSLCLQVGVALCR